MAKKRPQDIFERLFTAGSRGRDPYVAVQTSATRASRALQQLASLQERFAEAVGDPRTRDAAGRVLAMEAAQRKMNASLREQLSLAARRASVVDGSYAKEVRSLQMIARERTRVERIERQAALTSRYGRVGGAIASGAERYGGAAMGVAHYANNKLYGSAMSGFQGTVELNRLNTEFQLINREVAGSFRPAMTAATKSLQTLRRRLESMSTGQQDALMSGGLALAGGLGAHALSRTLFGVGLGTSAGRVAGSLTGMGGGGAALGALGLGAAGAAAGYGGETIGAAAALGGGLGAYRRTGVLRGAARAAAPVAAGVAVYNGVNDGYYSMLRGRGENKLTAGIGSLGGGAIDLLTGGRFKEHLLKTGQLKNSEEGANPNRRMVTIADAGFDAPGTAFERITNSLALRDAQDADTPAKMAESLDAINKNVEKIAQHAQQQSSEKLR